MRHKGNRERQRVEEYSPRMRQIHSAHRKGHTHIHAHTNSAIYTQHAPIRAATLFLPHNLTNKSSLSFQAPPPQPIPTIGKTSVQSSFNWKRLKGMRQQLVSAKNRASSSQLIFCPHPRIYPPFFLPQVWPIKTSLTGLIHSSILLFQAKYNVQKILTINTH